MKIASIYRKQNKMGKGKEYGNKTKQKKSQIRNAVIYSFLQLLIPNQPTRLQIVLPSNSTMRSY